MMEAAQQHSATNNTDEPLPAPWQAVQQPQANQQQAGTSVPGHQQQQQPLGAFVEMIIDRTQLAIQAATSAAGEAQRLLSSKPEECAAVLVAPQQPACPNKYLAAEAAMSSAEQALEVAMTLLQETQILVIAHQQQQQQQMQARNGGGIAAAAAPVAIPGTTALPGQQLLLPAQHAHVPLVLDPELQDTCDSWAASNSSTSAASYSTCGATSFASASAARR